MNLAFLDRNAYGTNDLGRIALTILIGSAENVHVRVLFEVAIEAK